MNLSLINEKNDKKNKSTHCHCSVRIEDLSVREGTHLILKSVSFAVNHGEILVLLGHNGSGKTTVLKSILNRVSYCGKICFFDSQGKKINKPKIGYVPQKLTFEKNAPLTVLEFFCANLTNFPIWIGSNAKIKFDIEEILEKFGVGYLLNKTIGSISGGELQRVLLAFALKPVPDILILDEPSSALDSKGVDFFYSLITNMRNEFHMPIILVSHDFLHVKKYATKYVLMKRGSVVKTDYFSNF
ncbi:MAG: ATP-binding cassette domain-containing protein [Oscillospiraceae bacterium]|jgi:zinc transport system ATP-binding protein|nr:ATP-binding cassette domain-containing protein [Oscillospiraceae bacterium]